MKKLLLFLCTFAFIACSDQFDELDTHKTESPEDSVSVYNVSCNNVTKDDIVNLKKAQLRITRGSYTEENKLYCIKGSESDTLLFICDDANGGWTIYSSDRRVPAIVAQSNSGSFEETMSNENAHAWIMTLAEDMRIIKRLKNSELNFSEEEIENNKRFWEAISSPSDFFGKKSSKTRNGVLPGEPLIIPHGHYELRYSYSYPEVYDSSQRFTTTNWSQGSPYNSFCPYKTIGSGRAPAGCVPIAGAQMLYFLHNHFDTPATAPSEAYCNGNIDEYSWEQTNYTTDIWDLMKENGIYAAPLIADVGRRLNVVFGNSGTSAYTSDLVSNVFEPYGINCDYLSYDEDVLKSNLMDSIPVLLSASTYVQIDGVTETVGHAFIADRYKRERTVTENYYVWVYDFYPPSTPLPYVPETMSYRYSSPVITKIGMNWGWGTDFNDMDEWYSLTGDWIKSEYNFNMNRKMICNFEIID